MSTQTITVTDEVYSYLTKYGFREPQVLKDLRNETGQLKQAKMQISPEQGQLMAMLIEMLGAKKTLDIGTFTGYSALAVAIALPQTGIVIACDIDHTFTDIAKKYWSLAGMEKKIDLKIAPAENTLKSLIDDGQEESFDFAFIDADKENYDTYYELALKLIRPRGLIAVDNVLWSGSVADDNIQDRSTSCIRALNAKIHQDRRVSMVMIPIGDGLTLAKKI